MSSILQMMGGFAAKDDHYANADAARREGEFKIASIRERGRDSQGTLRTRIAKSGITATGSALLAIESNEGAIERDAMTAKWQSDTEARRHKRAGKMALFQAAVGAGTSLMKGGAGA